VTRSTSVVDPPLVPGAPIAPGYRVITHLSRNQATDVYDVWSGERGCRCVAKALRPDRRTHERPRRRLLQEGRLLQAFTHPHLVRAYETIEDPDPVVILETLSGDTLAALLERRGRRLALSDVGYLGLQLCSTVHYLHGRGFLHLDIKPPNIVAQCGQAKLLDLSLAQPPGPGRPGVGTTGYRSPEQGRGGHFDEATDVWGIGVTLYESATGALPFPMAEGDDPQLERPARPVGSHRRLPGTFSRIVDACLAQDPRSRPSVPEVVAALAGALPADLATAGSAWPPDEEQRYPV